ncbi:DNA recombination protein RmuC [Salininema proteolyticum]|uniref:DNA recombination protein RmuC n=1 Tax=Salininema proteolyticum TaxID=1607685 RepID=A0ABV8TVU2_9ACTN
MTYVLLALVCLAAGAAGGFFVGRSRQEREVGRLRERLALAAEGGTSPELTAESRKRLEEAVSPLADSLERYREHLGEVEKARLDAYAQLRVQLSGVAEISEDLRDQTGRLAGALRAPNARGMWGEVQLKRLVESAGMVEHCDFDTQVSVSGARPDMVVRLSEDRVIVVDAKAPMEAYLEAIASEEGRERDKLLVKHAKQLRKHMLVLSERRYVDSFTGSADFVVLFVPADQVLDAALRADPGLLEESYERGVVVASPGSLLMLLKTAALTWRQARLAEHAQVVHELGRELVSRVREVAKSFSRLGSSLESAVGSYNDTVRALDSKVLSTARRFQELEVSGEEIPASRTSEAVVRGPAGD